MLIEPCDDGLIRRARFHGSHINPEILTFVTTFDFDGKYLKLLLVTFKELYRIIIIALYRAYMPNDPFLYYDPN